MLFAFITESAMAEYLVLLHEDPALTRDLSPTQMQALIQRYIDWTEGLRAEGLLTIGKKLKDEGGRHLHGGDRGKMVVSDGPYVEGKDVISGLIVITADSYEHAQALLAPGPHLEFGWIELREIDALS